MANENKMINNTMMQLMAAGSAAMITVTNIHPIDLVKTRLQVSSKYNNIGMMRSFKTIYIEEGLSSFWKGIYAAWLREASYTSIRLGLYEPIKIGMGINNTQNTSFFLKFVAGSSAGAIGSLFGNPFDVLKTKMMTNHNLLNTTPTISNTATTLYQSQGIAGFYRGIQANIMRAMVLNGTKMACYEECKDIIKKNFCLIGIPLQFLSAVCAGFFMTCTVGPFDMIRTQLMNQPLDKKIYNGFLDCGIQVIRKDGIFGLWKGFFPIWSRFAPTTCLQLILFEQIRDFMGMKTI
jgi:hypothetical protein